MYRIEVERRAWKALAGLPRRERARIEAAIEALAENPRPAGRLPVKAAVAGSYRIRVGSYRVVYVVLDQEQVVIVARIARRREDTYKGLR